MAKRARLRGERLQPGGLMNVHRMRVGCQVQDVPYLPAAGGDEEADRVMECLGHRFVPRHHAIHGTDGDQRRVGRRCRRHIRVGREGDQLAQRQVAKGFSARAIQR
jgi:hypothetical protein